MSRGNNRKYEIVATMGRIVAKRATNFACHKTPRKYITHTQRSATAAEEEPVERGKSKKTKMDDIYKRAHSGSTCGQNKVAPRNFWWRRNFP